MAPQTFLGDPAVIRTFFWHSRVLGPLVPLVRLIGKDPSNYFHVGNSGDLFVKDLLQLKYGQKVQNTSRGPRLLCVGSIAHNIQPGDVLCGVGIRDPDTFPHKQVEAVSIWGVRGPLTEQTLKAKGYDTSKVKFQLDPGLLIRFLFSQEELAKPGHDIIFIPHYRERTKYRRVRNQEYSVVDVDTTPYQLGKRILDSRLVLSSSLHGIIFAHGLGRPAVFVRPATEEPLFKYKDYFLSIGRDFPAVLEEPDVRTAARYSDTPVDLNIQESDFPFPAVHELVSRRIII